MKPLLHRNIERIALVIMFIAPWFFFSPNGMALWSILTAVGVLATLTFTTNWAGDEPDMMSVRSHLRTEEIAGACLIIAPFIADFYRTTWVPHVLLGAFLIVSSIITKYSRKDQEAAEMGM